MGRVGRTAVLVVSVTALVVAALSPHRGVTIGAISVAVVVLTIRFVIAVRCANRKIEADLALLRRPEQSDQLQAPEDQRRFGT